MKRYYSIFWWLLAISNVLACSEISEKPSLTLEAEEILDSIPSGSGMIINQNTAYVIGDDATGIYLLDLENFSHIKAPIKGMSNEYREPKEIKHDFESATLFEIEDKQHLMAFGSGSQLKSRDSLLLFNVNVFEDHRIFSLHEFYRELQRMTSTDIEHWNIEGVTVIRDSLILSNRGNNSLIKFSLKDFLNYILNPGSIFPKFNTQRVRLPMIGDKEARLSGLSTLNDSLVLFCASVEDTPDWTKDGPVLGSYIGIYSLKENRLLDSFLLKNKQGKVLKEKIESLDVLNIDTKGNIIIVAIGDNDDGSSKLFRLKLRSKEF